MAKLNITQAKKLLKVDESLDPKDRYKKAKRQYRKLAKEYHPDAGGTTEDFQIIQEAWDLYEESLNDTPTTKSKNQAYKPHYSKDRNIHTLFKEVKNYIVERESKHISLLRMSEDLHLSAMEYYQVEIWLSSFQKMRYVIGSKVNFMPTDLTLAHLEEALDQVNKGNYGATHSYYNESLSVDVYKALAKGLRKKTVSRKATFDFDLEDWEKE